MSTSWVLNTRGDPVNTLRNFIRTVWLQSRLDGMLVPINGSPETSIQPKLIVNPAQLDAVNPFKPIMNTNAAKLVPDLLTESSASYAAMFRPCELRALVEMAKRTDIQLKSLLTISIDCLGTLPSSEYSWRSKRKGSSDELTDETLQFARQGGIMAYRYRSACQLCIFPGAQYADINIGVLGVPVRQYMLVFTPDDSIAESLHLETITDGPAEDKLIEQRQKLLDQMAERRARTQERVVKGISDVMPADLDSLVEQLYSCGSCQSCLDACPICSVDTPRRDSLGRLLPQDVMRWMISCAGCGMCEQSCPQHQPLSAIFNHIRQQLALEFSYVAGRSIEEPLPVI